jgi:hypothetical protein
MRRQLTGSAVAGRAVDESTPPKVAVETTRTTLVLPTSLDQNLELYAVQSGQPKSEVIKQVLSEYLRSRGFQPDKTPKSISVAY